MKIVIAISHSFCANFISGQAAFLKNKGHEVVIVSAGGPEVTKLAESEKARLVEIPFSREISLKNDIIALFYVIKFLIREKPDIVNAGNPKSGFLFMLAGILFPTLPMIFTLRGLRSDTLTGLKKKIVYCTERISCKLAKKVIVISPSLKDHAISVGVLSEDNAVVIGKGSSNGVNIEKFHKNATNIKGGLELRSELKIKDTDFVLGYVGRITKDKGIEELYKAFKILCRKRYDIKLILTGPIEDDDPISQTLMHEMQRDENVFMLGKRNDLANVYLAYDTLVLYSYREGFGNVVLEASAMGIPTIVSDIPGARDTTEHMHSGLHVQPKDVGQLAKAIQFYIDHPHIRKQHGDFGSKRAQEFFASETIWFGQLDLYERLIS